MLQDMFRKEGRSLLQYVSESFPWTTSKNEAALAKFQEMVKEEQEATARLGRFLRKRKIRLPYLGAYPMSYTTINFVSFEHLLPYLIDFEKRRLAELEVDLMAATDDEAHALLRDLIELKRRHLQTLSGLAG
jgi:hypothetical protein